MTSRLCLSYGEPLPSAARVLGILKGKLGTRAAEFEALPQLGLTKGAEAAAAEDAEGSKESDEPGDAAANKDGKNENGAQAKARVAEVGGLMSATCLWHP